MLLRPSAPHKDLRPSAMLLRPKADAAHIDLRTPATPPHIDLRPHRDLRASAPHIDLRPPHIDLRPANAEATEHTDGLPDCLDQHIDFRPGPPSPSLSLAV